MSVKGWFIVFAALCFSSCKEDVSDAQEIQKEQFIPEGMEAKYNGEYIKLIDTAAVVKQPKRPILGNAGLGLGEVKLIPKEGAPKTINTFKKAYTAMSISPKGVRMRAQDMDYFQIAIGLSNDNAFEKLKGKYQPGVFGSKNYVAEVKLENVKDQTKFEKVWKSGTLTLEDFSAGLGTVVLKIEGVFQDQSTLNEEHISIEMNMRFDEVHSSIRPK